jgi:hypothetical protein
MPIPTENDERYQHTDSLTVPIDLSKVSAAVAEAFRQVLKIPRVQPADG